MYWGVFQTDNLLAQELATVVEEDEAVIEESSDELDAPEPPAAEIGAMIDERFVVPELAAEGVQVNTINFGEPLFETYQFTEEHHGIKHHGIEHHGIEGGSGAPESSLGESGAMIDEPADGFSEPELTKEDSTQSYDPSYLLSDASIEDFYFTDGIKALQDFDGVNSTWTTNRRKWSNDRRGLR